MTKVNRSSIKYPAKQWRELKENHKELTGGLNVNLILRLLAWQPQGGARKYFVTFISKISTLFSINLSNKNISYFVC